MGSRYNWPLLSYLALEKDIPVAAGGLRRADGGIGFFDSFITNPACDPFLRDEAINKIRDKLVEIAKLHCFKAILCFSPHYSLTARTEKIGFKRQDWFCSSLNLEVI
jgi:hypothetical protein